MGVPAGGVRNELDCRLRDEVGRCRASSATPLDRHLGKAISAMAGPTFQPVLHGSAVMLIFWLILFWMYRQPEDSFEDLTRLAEQCIPALGRSRALDRDEGVLEPCRPLHEGLAHTGRCERRR